LVKDKVSLSNIVLIVNYFETINTIKTGLWEYFVNIIFANMLQPKSGPFRCKIAP